MNLKFLMEQLKKDIEANQFQECPYVDTWEYEDEYSHNEIEETRELFIKQANAYFQENNMPYMMKEVVDNAMVCDLEGHIIK